MLSAPTCRSPLLITGVDASGSYRGQLGGAAYIISRLAASSLCGIWELFRVDQAATECWNAAPPAGSEAAAGTVVDAVRKVPAQDNTYPAAFWKRAAADAADAKTPIAIVFATDGDNDDQTAGAADSIHRSVVALAHNPNVQLVAIYGVNKENRDWLRTAFKPLGDRFVLSGPVKPADVQDLKKRLLAIR